MTSIAIAGSGPRPKSMHDLRRSPWERFVLSRQPMSRLCFLTSLAFGVVVSIAAPNASADEHEVRTDPTAARAVEVAATVDYVWVQQGGHDAYYGFQIAALYRATPRISLGVVGSHAISTHYNHLTRVMGEGVYHVLRTRFVDAWGATELGFAFSKFAPPVTCWFADGDVNPDGTPSNCEYYGLQKRTRVAPSAGVGAGLDFLPLPYVSLGAETRAIGVLFDTTPAASGPNESSATRNVPGGPTLTLYAGVTLALHAPLP
jgi:hypothetical protein